MNSIKVYRANGSRGMTLLEIAVSVAIISAVVLTTVQVMHISADHMGFQQVIVDQQDHTRAALDNMMAELKAMRDTGLDFNTDKLNTATGKMTGIPSANNTLTGAPLTYSTPYPKGVSTTGIVEPDAIQFNIPVFNAGTNSVDLGTATTAITYRWVSYGNNPVLEASVQADKDYGRIERIVNGVLTNVVLDSVPQDGFLVIKQDRRLAIRIGQMNNTTITTNNGTKVTTFVTQITYCLRNY
ncbi:MAG: hypothetical protein HY291_13320 [Planctomycetes bacterium]|nr:hypothetical protein [Planctomycetota bacterium]